MQTRDSGPKLPSIKPLYVAITTRERLRPQVELPRAVTSRVKSRVLFVFLTGSLSISKIITCLQRVPLQDWLAGGSQHVCINLKYTNLGSCSESVQALIHAARKWLRSTLCFNQPGPTCAHRRHRCRPQRHHSYLHGSLDTMAERARRPDSRSIGSHTRVYR